MEPIEIIGQAVGIVAMLVVTLSFQGKQQRTIFVMQCVGNLLFAVHFLMIGATVGGLLNFIGSIRGAVFYYKDRLKADRLPWFVAFIISYLAVYVLNFTLFGKEATAFNLIIEFLPVVGMIALNVGFRLKKAADVRRCGAIASPAWMIYNAVLGSWGGFICDSMSLISIIIGMWRHDKKGKE